jgi:hypothetical protein
VFTARYALSPYIKQIRFVFKGLNTRAILPSPYKGERRATTSSSIKERKRVIKHRGSKYVCLSACLCLIWCNREEERQTCFSRHMCISHLTDLWRPAWSSEREFCATRSVPSKLRGCAAAQYLKCSRAH